MILWKIQVTSFAEFNWSLSQFIFYPHRSTRLPAVIENWLSQSHRSSWPHGILELFNEAKGLDWRFVIPTRVESKERREAFEVSGFEKLNLWCFVWGEETSACIIKHQKRHNWNAQYSRIAYAKLLRIEVE